MQCRLHGLGVKGSGFKLSDGPSFKLYESDTPVSPKLKSYKTTTLQNSTKSLDV